MNKIIINRGSFRLDEVAFEQGTTTIGRANDNTITLDDTAVSSHHAKIVTLFNTSYIEDLDSTNGTLVNGKAVQKRALHTGDVIAIGNHQLLFRSDIGAQKPSETSDTVMLQGSEIKQRLNEFMQAQSELEQPRRAGQAAANHKAPAPASAANQPPPVSSDAIKNNGIKDNGFSDRKTPALFGADSNVDSPSLDMEKNKAWLEAKKSQAPVEKPAPGSESNTTGTKTATATIDTSTNSISATAVEQAPDSIAPIARNTAAAISGTVKESDPTSSSPSAETRASSPDKAPQNTPSTLTTKSADSAKSAGVGPTVPAEKTTIDIAAAARTATQQYQHRRNGDRGYANNSVMALNRSKPRNRIMPTVWLLIVAVLVAEVVYITYRSVG